MRGVGLGNCLGSLLPGCDFKFWGRSSCAEYFGNGNISDASWDRLGKSICTVERRQQKTFLTQIGLTLPLTTDPPVIYFWKWIGWKDYEVPKNRNFESISGKNELFFSPRSLLPAPRTQFWAHVPRKLK
jgi:hypothetical protein